ncbi:MlaD family protein [Massilia horti]|uniref:MCE family protein n=1 Tax=Massilia horti TaxID=2562153 RepID=A0A4Y9T0S0_9BURK|nr:MlaD family protein [Massilia horti]TFW31145.1 MCE family protein [Massilia horti]
MESRSHALMTGFFTIALLIAAVLVGLWLNRDRTEKVPYEIVTTQSIPGLNPQAVVRYRGLEVGRVDDIMFDPQVTGQILVKLSVDAGSPITTTTFASLGYQGVTGIAFVQLDDDRTGSPLLRSDPRHPGRIPLRPGLLDQLEKRGLAILEKTERIATGLDKLMSPENQRIMVGAFDNIGKAAQAYAAIPQKLEPTLARLPALTDKLDDMTTSATSTMRNFDRLGTSLQAPDGPIARLNGAIEKVGGSLVGVTNELELQTLPHVNDMTDEAKSSLRAVKRTATALSDRPQSILFGAPNTQPGPGEPGFVPPTK